MINIAPWQLGLPHADWRPFQLEAFNDAKNALSKTEVVIMEAPVGIGKTAIAGALSDRTETTVLVQNLGLLNQYKDYGFSILMGKSEYECVLESKVRDWESRYGRTPTAGDCHFRNMHECKKCLECPYFIAREEAFNSPRMACTYKYGVVSERLQKRTGLIIMDEIHNAVREFLGIESFTMSDTERIKYDMPDFPLFEFGKNAEGDVLDTTSMYQVLGWVTRAINCVSQIDLFDEVSPVGADKRKIFNSLSDLQGLLYGGDDIFYKCTMVDSWSKRTGQMIKEPLMEIRSLTPKRVYDKVISGKDRVFMMSATIGDPTALICGEFGITDWHYQSWPHPVPADKRPIFNIADYAMTHSNIVRDPNLYKKQAMRIAKWINNDTDKSYRGIVLTTSNLKVNKLREHLAPELRGGRKIFRLPDYRAGLQERINTFVTNSDEGVVHIDTIQGWGTGVDLRGDIARYSVVAGVPLPNPVDRFDQLRFSTESGKAYAYAYAYNSVMQATGRVTRGEQDDDGAYVLNIGALADMMATAPLAMRFYSKWFKDAIVRG